MKNLIFLGGIFFALISCNSGNKESSSATSSSEDSKNEVNISGKSYNCLKDFQDAYDELLTKEDMASVYPIDFEAAEVDLNSGSYGNHTYSWPSDRPEIEMEVSGMKMKVPDNNTMGVALLSFYDEDSDMKSNRALFDRGYKKLSDAELKEIEENLNKQEDDVKEAGKKMMKTRVNMKWDFVDGVGSSAWYKWGEKYGGELAVLAGNAKFYIRLKVSDDPQENLDLAKKLAQKVLEKC